jgi:hypothetical protein
VTPPSIAGNPGPALPEKPRHPSLTNETHGDCSGCVGVNVSPGTIHFHRGQSFGKTACILKERGDYLVPAPVDLAVMFSRVDAGETSAEMTDTPVPWPDKDLSGKRHYSHLIGCVYATRRKRSQPFRENKRAGVCCRDHKLTVRVDSAPQSVLPNGGHTISERIGILECGWNDDISKAVDVTSLVAFSASPLPHMDGEQPGCPCCIASWSHECSLAVEAVQRQRAVAGKANDADEITFHSPGFLR